MVELELVIEIHAKHSEHNYVTGVALKAHFEKHGFISV